MSFSRCAVLLFLGCGACGASRATGDTAEPEAILARAIEQAGGSEALVRARALTWNGDAIVHAGGRTISITGRWAVQPPDTAIVATYDVTRGPATIRSLIIAAPRGWTLSATGFTPLLPGVLANERDEFYLYDVMRLVSLRARGVSLRRIAADPLGQRGFRAMQSGRPPVDLYVDGRGRLAHLRMMVAAPGGGPPVRQDVFLEGAIEADGVRWPAKLRLTMAGAPYFDLTIRSLRTLPRLQDSVLAGPRR